MSGLQASKCLSDELTAFELTEVLKYQEVYYLGLHEAKREASDTLLNHGFDDENGNYLMQPNDHLDYRYEIRALIGRGSFGQVMECFDYKHKCRVAVKVVTSALKFRRQSKVELSILEFVNRSSPSEHIVRMKAYFSFRNHICIVLELLGSNLYQLSKLNKHQGFPVVLVKAFTSQIVSALTTLHTYKVVHCDLKPENILLVEGHTPSVKLIDFGSSCYETHTLYTYIQSRYYRAPEIILGLKYGCGVDMWSLGCVVAELVNGTPLFEGDCNTDQLLAMMEVLGMPPRHLLTSSQMMHKFFRTMTEPIILPNKRGYLRKPSSTDLASVIKSDDSFLIDFVARCLNWDAPSRLTAEEARRHPWLVEDPATAKTFKYVSPCV
jgi:dual specificity tyrosine-phosphorylation-regulated kinase 2/3/4